MTKIENPETYKSLNRVYLINKDFTVTPIGIYDPLFEIASQSYVSGTLLDADGRVYPDEQYQGKQCTVLRFEHHMINNSPVLNKIGNSHEHAKVIVSTNEISLDDVRVVTKKGDIFYYAELITEPFVINGGEFALYEVEPHLNKDEILELRTDVNAVAKMKNKLAMALTKERKMEAELFVANASITGAEAHINSLNFYLNQYKAQLDKISEQAIQMGFAQSELVIGMTKEIEKKFNLDMDWREQMKSQMAGDVNSKANAISKFFSNFNQYQHDKHLTDTMKEYMVDVIVDICGIEYILRRIDEIKRNGKLTEQPQSMIGNSINLMQQTEKGIISNDRSEEIMKNAMTLAQNEYGKTGNMEVAFKNAIAQIPYVNNMVGNKNLQLKGTINDQNQQYR